MKNLWIYDLYRNLQSLIFKGFLYLLPTIKEIMKEMFSPSLRVRSLCKILTFFSIAMYKRELFVLKLVKEEGSYHCEELSMYDFIFPSLVITFIDLFVRLVSERP